MGNPPRLTPHTGYLKAKFVWRMGVKAHGFSSLSPDKFIWKWKIWKTIISDIAGGVASLSGHVVGVIAGAVAGSVGASESGS